MSPVGWIVTPGEAGFESQGRGLAEALGLEPVFKRVRADWPWQRLPGRFWLNPLARLAESSERLDPPWPDVVISCGKIAAPLAAAMRRASGGRVKVAHIQNPLMGVDRFDVVVAPRHDGIRGENVLSTVGAIHPVTPEKLSQAAQRWAPAFSALPRPLVGVLVGGSNGRFRLDPPTMSDFAARLAALAQQHGAGLLVTPSRRTGKENEAVLAQALAGLSTFVWDGQGENPYLGILALSDAIVVTEDSVSMTSEALATGKPVHVVRLPGDSARLRRFQDDLITEGYTRPFTGTLEGWTYTPLDDTARAAAMCRQRFGWK